MELLKELCECPGVPGKEERLRKIVRRELEPMADDIRIDALGNLIAFKQGRKGAKKLMIAAHMDEIGFLVNHIDENGFLRIVPLGGHDPRNMVAQRVTVSGKQKDLPGLLYPGIKPPHIQSEADRKKELKGSDFCVDLYLPASRVKREVEIGSMVTLNREFLKVGNGVSCKAMDNRLSVYVMIRAMQRAKRFGFDTYAVATTQEEVGVRGATVSAYEVEPDVGVALDITLAADIPGVEEHERVTRLGEGTAIKLMDSYSISHPGLVTFLKNLAGRRKIRYQIEILPRGGTDAGAMQLVRSGAPVVTLSVPTRYVHTSIELAAKKDIEATVRLLTAFVEEGQKANLELH